MEKIDYGLQIQILKACFKTYPKACVVKEFLKEKFGVKEEVSEAEIIYMIESGLLRCEFFRKERHSMEIPKEVSVFITAKGIDYLHDGGLGLKINQCLSK